MMEMNRRGFLVGGAAAGLAMSVPSESQGQAKPVVKKAVLKISSQEGRIAGKDLPEKMAKLEKWGFDGIEFGGGGLPNRINEIQSALKNSKLKISTICSGYQGALISDQESERQKAVDTMKEILTAAGELGATGMILVPAFNGQTKLNHVEGRKILLDLLPQVGDHAAKCGTRVMMEPLNRGEAWFLRQLADAASICRDAKNPGVFMMGDFYHMYIEETSDMGAFISAGDYLHHVHLASRRRVLPGQDERSFVNGFKGLKYIGYQDFCSLECGCDGDPDVETPKSVKFLRAQWAQA